MLELYEELVLGGANREEHDCYSFASKVIYATTGKKLPKLEVPEGSGERNELVNSSRNDFIRLSEPKVPCIITFKLHPKFVTHVGVYIENNKFIHYTRKKGVAIETLNGHWKDKIEGFYTY